MQFLLDMIQALTEQMMHSVAIDMVLSLVFLNGLDMVMGSFSSASSLPQCPFIVRNDSLETVSVRPFILLQDSSSWAGIFGRRGLAFGFNRLRATLVAMLMVVDRELSACALHCPDDSLWLGSRPCGISEL